MSPARAALTCHSLGVSRTCSLPCPVLTALPSALPLLLPACALLSYHLFAAAVAARLDPAWAETQRERLLLYARDIANPSREDAYFPQWRHKDW